MLRGWYELLRGILNLITGENIAWDLACLALWAVILLVPLGWLGFLLITVLALLGVPLPK